MRPAPPYRGSKVGFPIRKSLDQSSFAAPQGLSQRTTSFIASQRQGIHQMLLRHLIALMIDVRCATSLAAAGHPSTVTKRPAAGSSRIPPLYACRTHPTRRSRARPGRIPSSRCQTSAPGDTPPGTKLDLPRVRPIAARRHSRERMVELDGIEPTTSCLQSTRSPN